MLNEQIKSFRKAKGLSQEELAGKLHVVRQTVSKWEKGLSVPDAEMLIKIAEALDCSVAALLDAPLQTEERSELKVLAEQLEQINEQLAKQKESSRKMRRAIFLVVAVAASCFVVGGLVSFFYFQAVTQALHANTAVIGGSDGPTNILLSRTAFQFVPFLFAVVLAVISFIGIYKTRRK